MQGEEYSPNKIYHHRDTIDTLRKGKQPVPKHLQLILSDFCNQACHFCAYRMPDYSSNQLFKVVDPQTGIVNNNPNRMIPYDKVIEILNDCKELGIKACQFSVEGSERLPLINPNGDFVVLAIQDFVNQFFPQPCVDYESKDISACGWKSFAINDEGELIEDVITHVYRHPATENLVKVTLEDGRTATVTQSHSLNVIRGGKIQKIPVKDINLASDRIACVDWKINPSSVLVSSVDDAGRYLEVPPTADGFNSNENYVHPRVSLENQDFFRLLGYYVAEGSKTTNGVCFIFGNGPREDNYREDVDTICQKVFMLPTSEIGSRAFLNSVRIKKLFTNLGLCVPQAERNIPNIVWASSDLCKQHFLAGLFAGDGNFRSSLCSKGYNRNSLHLKACNPNLAQEVAVLLRQLGVKASNGCGINKKRKIEDRELEESNYYTVNVYGKNNLEKLPIVLNILNAKLNFKDSSLSNPGSRTHFTRFGKQALSLRIKNIEKVVEMPVVYDVTVAKTHRFISTSGIGFFNTGGGEPTVHPKFQQIVDHANSLGLEWSLVTNGTLLHRLDVSSAAWVRVSIDTNNATDYSKIRQVNESMYHQVWRNVKSLAESKPITLTLGVGYVVTNENYKGIFNFCEQARNVGVDNVRISAFFQNAGSNYYSSETYEDIKRQLLAIKAFQAKDFKVFDNFGSRFEDLEVGHPDYSFCGYQHFTTYLGADLNLYRCCVTSYNNAGLLGSCKNRSFADLIRRVNWDNNFDAHDCPRCMFNNKNKEILYALSTNPKHVNFV